MAVGDKTIRQTTLGVQCFYGKDHYSLSLAFPVEMEAEMTAVWDAFLKTVRFTE